MKVARGLLFLALLAMGAASGWIEAHTHSPWALAGFWLSTAALSFLSGIRVANRVWSRRAAQMMRIASPKETLQ